MEINEIWLKEISKLYPDIQILKEGGYNYILIKKLNLPERCTPNSVDALLCINKRDGYDSRLFVSHKVEGCDSSRNWNSVASILDNTWFAMSWRSKPGLTYLEMLMVHLKAFK